jgi:hypothetical protein
MDRAMRHHFQEDDSMKMRTIQVSALALVFAMALPAITRAQLPSKYHTPGAAAKIDVTRLCSAEFTGSIKPITHWQRDEVLTRYGIRPESFDGTLDHLIPVSLGGTNDPDNVYPFHASGEFTVDGKNQLGERLHQLVCDGKLSLKDAQSAVKKDWTRAYKQYVQASNAPGQ